VVAIVSKPAIIDRPCAIAARTFGSLSEALCAASLSQTSLT